MFKSVFNATCKYRCSEDKIQNLKEIIDTVYDSKTMNTWWENYRKENNYVGELTWHNVVDSVSSLVEKIVYRRLTWHIRRMFLRICLF